MNREDEQIPKTIWHLLPDLVGKPRTRAVTMAHQAGFFSRVVRVDGRSLVATRDLRQDRVNFHVDDGFVTKAYVG